MTIAYKKETCEPHDGFVEKVHNIANTCLQKHSKKLILKCCRRGKLENTNACTCVPLCILTNSLIHSLIFDIKMIYTCFINSVVISHCEIPNSVPQYLVRCFKSFICHSMHPYNGIYFLAVINSGLSLLVPVYWLPIMSSYLWRDHIQHLPGRQNYGSMVWLSWVSWKLLLMHFLTCNQKVPYEHLAMKMLSHLINNKNNSLYYTP